MKKLIWFGSFLFLLNACSESPTKNEEEQNSSTIGSSSLLQGLSSIPVGLSEQGQSSDVPSSSSRVLPSSSSEIALLPVAPQAPDWCAVDPANCGTILDARDNRTYKWTKIGTQTWMAENLKYSGAETGTRVGWCPGVTTADSTLDHPSCESIGRKYSWTQLNKASSASLADPQGLCPAGWHVISHDEWMTLTQFLRTSNNLGSIGDIGYLLKATNSGSNKWDNAKYNAGNPYQFSALPDERGDFVMYWTNDEQGIAYGWGQSLSAYSSEAMSNLLYAKNEGAFARCIMDRVTSN